MRPSKEMEEEQIGSLFFGRRAIEYRNINGLNNNLLHPDWGSIDEFLLRKCSDKVSYTDDMGEMYIGLNPREISNGMCFLNASQQEVKLEPKATAMVFQWGQFLDHDIDFTKSGPNEFLEIEVNDPGLGVGTTIPFFRSQFVMTTDPSSASTASSPVRRQHRNVISAFIDASNVYGTNYEDRNMILQAEPSGTAIGGLFRIVTYPYFSTLNFLARGELAVERKSNGDDQLPYNTDELENDGEGTKFRLAGDIRANEQPGLTAMHTLFVREHNRRAAIIRRSDYFNMFYDWATLQLRGPLSATAVYEQARAWVGAHMQAITYNEFLPVLFGALDQDAMDAALGGPYDGYKDDVDPQIATEFSTAAFRFGHSMISSDFLCLNDQMEQTPSSPISLRDGFFQTDMLVGDVSMECLLRGLSHQKSQELDSLVVEDVRSFLFGELGMGGADLCALNIQRGRDHGLCLYNDMRQAYGLTRKSSFADLCPEGSTGGSCQQLEATYTNNDNNSNTTTTIDQVDVWVAGLAEPDHVWNCPTSTNPQRTCTSLVGETFFSILTDQFQRLRNGDRFWYENSDSTLTMEGYDRRFTFTSREIEEIRTTTLADVIRRNTRIGNEIPNLVFQS